MCGQNTTEATLSPTGSRHTGRRRRWRPRYTGEATLMTPDKGDLEIRVWDVPHTYLIHHMHAHGVSGAGHRGNNIAYTTCNY